MWSAYKFPSNLVSDKYLEVVSVTLNLILIIIVLIITTIALHVRRNMELSYL